MGSRKLASLATLLFLLLFASWVFPQHGMPGVGGGTPSSGQPGVNPPYSACPAKPSPVFIWDTPASTQADVEWNLGLMDDGSIIPAEVTWFEIYVGGVMKGTGGATLGTTTWTPDSGDVGSNAISVQWYYDVAHTDCYELVSTGETLTVTANPAAVYDDATAIWTFNEPTFLGAEGNDVRVQYAMHNDGTDTTHASAADSAALSGGTDGFTVCVWGNPNTVTDDDVWIKKDDYGSQREWTLRNATARPTIYLSHSCTTFQRDRSTSVNAVAGEDHLVCAIYDATNLYASIYMNGTLSSVSAPLASAMCDGTAPVNVGGMTTAGGNKDGFDGTLGPVYWWKGTLVAEATLDALYAGGRGMPCSEAIVEDSSMTRCWDLDEDPTGGAGAYKEEVTAGVSDNMTPTNSPTRVSPGIVLTGTGDPDLYLTAVNDPEGTGGALGYAMDLTAASSQYASVTNASSLDFMETGDFTIVFVGVLESNFSSAVLGSKDTSGTGWYAMRPGGGADDTFDFTTRLSFGSVTNCQSQPSNVGTHMYAIQIDRAEGKQRCSTDGEAWVEVAFGGINLTSTADWHIGRINTTYHNSGFDAMAVWEDSSVTSANLTTFYNSGKFVECEVMESAGADHCYLFNEDGGPYADHVASLNLTAVNTPTRAAGLVERSDSGMGTITPSTGDKYFTLADSTDAFEWTATSTVAIWHWHDGVATAGGFMLRKGGADANVQWQVNGHGASLNRLLIQIYDTGYTSNYWAATSASGQTIAPGWNLFLMRGDAVTGCEYRQNGNAWRDCSVGAGTPTFPLGNGSGETLYFARRGTVNTSGMEFPYDNIAWWDRRITDDEADGLWAAGAGTFYEE